eukprot:GFYU01006577.1.p1 GENE.GFYU01006577.1~~GFYU01006577.1.p1  ORF type:complete len:338 (-),score=129.39 GFYU01006577.1:74-1087(-)
MKTTFFVLAALIAVAAASVEFTDIPEPFVDHAAPHMKFLSFQTQFGKKYESNAEWEFRFNVFQNNLKKIDALNKNEKAIGGGALFGITKFADMHEEEFKDMYLTAKTPANYDNAPEFQPTTNDTPKSIDWRTKGAVTPVKNQEQCGSCWAFSATEEIESAWFLAKGQTVDLSPQQIVSCDTTCYGCGGGWTYLAYEYVMKAGGMEAESDYPYTSGGGDSGTCKFDASDVKVTISGYEYATKTKDETKMASAMAEKGPISVCVDASSWQFYQSGVLKSCGTQIDHCVQAVGYDTSDDGTPYWTVRNSWGTTWGISGYILVERGTNTCAISEVATLVNI